MFNLHYLRNLFQKLTLIVFSSIGVCDQRTPMQCVEWQLYLDQFCFTLERTCRGYVKLKPTIHSVSEFTQL